ncbi:ATP-dependent zinc metalloprotease FtsH [Pseudodesulfovibrio thermohalotolerans]|uniref:ATP-dependent zinc metalloprotease FtsH n=1 Tax=Pseudodesulfovibrio thermohalotolerans TaxID=2880651 RepID=UPI0024437043|nr:ATP-dependent zinc metalloprotease FtsH [Pseudodesulfovibrio thermohalotolerans]WFS61315.1 ATP-dependent zinc metalloprotease FtsH [Pseudodesulfovibrio thermohalotolerans]
MNNHMKNLVIWAIIFILMVVLFNLFNQPPVPKDTPSYSEFLAMVDSGSVAQVKIQGQKIVGLKSSGEQFQTYAPEDPRMIETLISKGVEVKAEPPDESPWYMTLLLSWFPMILLIGVWIFFMRQMQGGGSGGRGAMSFGRSKARLVNEETAKVTFDDVAGVDEAKEELSEVVDFLREPRKFTRLGGRIPKGVLLVGGPGTGKTLLARAVAGEANVPFFSISGSDFVEMFVGVGASRVRDLFAQGKKNAPCLIFIDEIDAVGRQRGAGLGGGHDEREQTLNQLLVEMDGFESNEGVILVAATNRPDVLDPALLRPGRFDRQVVVPNPDLRGRERILKVHSRKTPLAPEVNLEIIAKGTPGFSGADLENLVNEAALGAAKLGKDRVDMDDFEEAKDKVMMGGRERRSMILSEEDKRTTAYHEGGHALVAKLLPGTDPVHKVSIIPRGRALGVTMQLPGEDRHNYSKQYLCNNMAVLMGGRVAEEVVLDQLTTGASNDIERATKTAHNMVCMWGMSDKLGPMSFGDNQEQVFLGRELIHNKNYGEETAKLIDSEVRRFVDEAYEKATAIIKDNREVLDAISMALLERETITGADIDLLMAGKELPPMEQGGKSGNGNSGNGRSDTASGYTADGRAASSSGPGYEPVSEKPGDSGDSGDDFILDDGGDEPDGDDGKNKLQ